MRQDILRKWINALKSGRWKKCQKRLKTGDRRCASGVLCEVAVENSLMIIPTVDGFYAESRYFTINTPECVRKWLGATIECLNVLQNVVALNDSIYSDDFKEEVAYLETHLTGEKS